MGCFTTYASGTLDPPEVRNWRLHVIACVASMSALASRSMFQASEEAYTDSINSGLRHRRHWRNYGPRLVQTRLWDYQYPSVSA